MKVTALYFSVLYTYLRRGKCLHDPPNLVITIYELPVNISMH